MSAIFSMGKSLTIDKNKVRQCFSQAAMTYDGFSSLQRKVGLDLLNIFTSQSVSRTDKIIVDIGCGTGFFTRQLIQKTDTEQVIAIDIALSMLQITKARLDQIKAVHYLCADAEHLPLANHSADIIVSNLALQWCQNLTDVFAGFNRTLKDQGQIIFSTFGTTTLKELKQAWFEVDDYKHVNEFYSADQLLAVLQQSGFKNIQVETKVYQSRYQTVMELMRELKGIGANTVLSGANRKTTTKTDMQKMLEAYEKFRVDGFIPATYEIVFISAKTEL